MSFEVQNALLTLDARTPDFLVREAFSEKDQTARRAASKILLDLGEEPQATKQLLGMLRLY